MVDKPIYFKSIKEWRAWLIKNHLKKDKVTIIRYKKHTGKKSPTPHEFMHEAICFGWIDTTAKRVDEDTYSIRYSRRSPSSRWSHNTLRYGRNMIEEWRMFPEGLRCFLLGINRPVLGHDIPDNPDVPNYLEKELNKNKKAKNNFYGFSPSLRRMLLRWLLGAKTEETRKKRVKEIVRKAIENEKRF